MRVEVGGAPPPSTRKPGVVYHRKTNRVYVFGGDKPDDEVKAEYRVSDRPIEQRNSIYVLNAEDEHRLSWSGPIASDDPAPYLRTVPTGALPRSEHVWMAAANPDYLMAQGGNSMARGVSYMDQGGLADWLAFDTRSNRWTELQPAIAHDHETWAIPVGVHRLPVLSGHAGVLDGATGRALVLMAFEEEWERYPFDPEHGLPGFMFESGGEPSDWDFRALETNGEGPSLRAWYTASVVGRHMIVFGGAHQVFRQRRWNVLYPDDVRVLDLDTLCWSRLDTSGDKPSGRIHHGAIALDDRRLLVAGGSQGFGKKSRHLPDAYVLDVASSTWTRITSRLTTPRDAAWVGFGPPGDIRVFALGGDHDGFPVFELDPALYR